MPSCSVRWCGNSSKKSNYSKDGITFHRFPTVPEYKEKWLKAVQRENWFPTKYSVVCSRHFTTDCFESLKNRRRLFSSAVPTLFLPVLASQHNTSNLNADSPNVHELSHHNSSSLNEQVHPQTENLTSSQCSQCDDPNLHGPFLNTTTISRTVKVDPQIEALAEKRKMKRHVEHLIYTLKQKKKNIKKLQAQNRLLKKKLEKDMENYTRFKIMGSVRTVRVNRDCVPSRFDCQVNKKGKSSMSKARLAFIKRQRNIMIKELKQNSQKKDGVPASNKDLLVERTSFQNNSDKIAVDTPTAILPDQDQEHIFVNQVNIKKEVDTPTAILPDQDQEHSFINQGMIKNEVCSAPKKPTICIDATSSKTSISTQPTSDLNLFIKNEYDSDGSLHLDIDDTPLIAGITDDISAASQLSIQTQTISETTSQNEFEEVEKMSLQSTLSKIKKKPQLYIGLPKKLYYVIDLIKKRTSLPEENILLCLMRIKLNRTYSELADDFDCSVMQARHIFINKLPLIVEELSTFIQPSMHQVTCVIDGLEFKVQKPKKATQAQTCSNYKKSNTIKYLLACTPDGHISFVSTGYAGRITYVSMVERSKFLDTLQPGASILANKGFKTIELYLSQKGFTLLRSPSVTAGLTVSGAGLQQARQIARLRIHSRRVIRRLREFSMLKIHSVVKSNLIYMLDLCIKTACALINLQNTNEKNLYLIHTLKKS